MGDRGADTAPGWPHDVAVPPRAVARRGAVAVCETWVLPLAMVETWLREALPGESLVYARGPRLLRGETSTYVRTQYEAGSVEPSQPRAEGCHGFDYRIRKLPPPAGRGGAGGASAAAEKPPIDPRALAIYAAIRDAAARGVPCPSNRALARAAGLPTAQAASWRVTAMRDAGLFEIETDPHGPEGPWRVIVMPDGSRTAGAPSADRRRA